MTITIRELSPDAPVSTWTDQEVFDRACFKVLEQGVQAKVGGPDGVCSYRGKVGGKNVACAVGHLLPDTSHDVNCKGSLPALSPVTHEYLGAAEDSRGGSNRRWKLLSNLQEAHDSWHGRDGGTDFPEYFTNEARKIAAAFNLNRTILRA